MQCMPEYTVTLNINHFPVKSLCLASISVLGWIFTLSGEKGEMAASSYNFRASQKPEFTGKRSFLSLSEDPQVRFCGAELWPFPEPITVARG